MASHYDDPLPDKQIASVSIPHYRVRVGITMATTSAHLGSVELTLVKTSKAMSNNVNTAPKIENFVTSLRVAIEQLGASTVQLRNVINAELGNMRKVKDGTPATGAMKVKRPKDETKGWTATNGVKLGTAKYEARATMAHIVKELNDNAAKCEVSCPTLTLCIPADSAMGKWIVEYGKARNAEPAKPTEPDGSEYDEAKPDEAKPVESIPS